MTEKPDMSHLPLCDCADKGSTCLGRQPGVACMAHDDWYTRPAIENQYVGVEDDDL